MGSHAIILDGKYARVKFKNFKKFQRDASPIVLTGSETVRYK